jgi:hypothetical protein
MLMGAHAAPALEWWTFSEPSQRLIRIDAEQDLQQADQPFAVRVQKAEVAGPPKAFGQDMPEDQPQELRAG